MVFKLPIWVRHSSQALVIAAVALSPKAGVAAGMTAQQYIEEARGLYDSGQFFKSARYAFNAKDDAVYGPTAYAWVTTSLLRAGLDQTAAYFFIRTLQSGSKTAIKHVLTYAERILLKVGPDQLREYLVKHTTYEDYDALNRSAYLFALGKQALLQGNNEAAIGYIKGIPAESPLWQHALQLKAAAYSISGKFPEAIADFRQCQKTENRDLKSRCLAGEARTLYQKGDFAQADRAYDQIPKESIVWPDILFEQAWNSFAKQEYNRTLGRLVTYKAPALEFVFNSEVEVLRAQTYLMLCLYGDANETINEFNAKYSAVGEQTKKFVEGNATRMDAFFRLGREAASGPRYTKNPLHHLTNQFVRRPYFQELLQAERTLTIEKDAIRAFASTQPGVKMDLSQGFPGFLNLVLQWRLKSITSLGGAFVKNSLLDYHAALIADFEKIAFIKLDMLSRAKEKLLFQKVTGERVRGNVVPSRRDDQYFWTFNGEFWNDELGDYVFGLESECGGGKG